MTKGKVVIVALVVIGLLFAFGLGTNLMPKEDEDKGPGGYQSGWLEGMDRLMGRFSPRLDRGRLQPDRACNKQKGGGYKFTSNTACNIGIASLAEDAKDDYQTATLLVSNAANISVPCPEQGASATERGMLARIKVKPMVMQAKPPVVAFPAGATLTVVYTPKGKNPEKPACPGKDEVRLVALKEGGSLRLQCNGCSTSRFVKVDFKK
jgi:hypothetical protein